MKYAFSVEKDSRYKKILDEITAEEDRKWDAHLDEVLTRDIKGDCNGTGIGFKTYKCLAGQTRRQCVPIECQDIGKSGKMHLEFEAKERFLAEKVSAECDQYR